MTNYQEPDTHIDIRVIKNLLITRINEGNELIMSESTSREWKRNERAFIKKCQDAIQIIDEAIKIKEGKFNEASQNKNPQQGTANYRQNNVQNQGDKA
jgi:hypothetical protein